AVMRGSTALPAAVTSARAAMGRYLAGVKHFQPVHAKEVDEAADGVVSQMLVIDRVVLQIIKQADQVMRFRDEHAVGRKHFHNALDDRMDVLDMREAIRGGDHLGGAMLFLDL